MIEKSRINQAEKESILGKINIVSDLDMFKDADLVIEAIIENEKIKKELSSYDKKLSTKKEIIFFNKSDLLKNEEIKKKLIQFKKKIKNKYEVISIFSHNDIKKVKKILVKYVN